MTAIYRFLILLNSFILQFFIGNMGVLVKVATILSFLTAPFYAILNYILIFAIYCPKRKGLSNHLV